MKFRDIELISSYLDGQLSPSESARLESRLSSDSNLRAAMHDLREARGLLRQLPARKAPRNFTLTRQMVGLKPPLPRAYPTFRFATALATLLLVVTFAVNALGSSLSKTAAAPAYGLGGGGGGPCQGCGGGAPETYAAPATEAPAMEAPTEAPAATQMPALAPSLELQLTATPSAADSARQSETPTPQQTPTEAAPLNTLPQVPPQAQGVQRSAPGSALIPVTWQIGLAVIGVACGLIAFLMQTAAKQKWK
jgi:hypothetical protein